MRSVCLQLRSICLQQAGAGMCFGTITNATHASTEKHEVGDKEKLSVHESCKDCHFL